MTQYSKDWGNGLRYTNGFGENLFADLRDIAVSIWHIMTGNVSEFYTNAYGTDTVSDIKDIWATIAHLVRTNLVLLLALVVFAFYWQPLYLAVTKVTQKPAPAAPISVPVIVPPSAMPTMTPSPTLTPTVTPTSTITPSPTTTPLPMPVEWGKIRESGTARCIATNGISEEEFLEMASSLQLEGEWRYFGSGGLLYQEGSPKETGIFLEGCFNLYPWPAPETGDFYLDAIPGYRMVRDRIIPVLFSRYWYQIVIDHNVFSKTLVQP